MGTAQIIGCMVNSKKIDSCKLVLRNSECACYTKKSFQPC